MRIGSSGRICFSVFSVSMPFLSGMEMSSSTTSNSDARTSWIASLPVAASPATCMSGWSAMNCLSPARTIA